MYGTRFRTVLYHVNEKRDIWEEAEDNLSEAQVRMKGHYDKSTASDPIAIAPGQRAMLKHFTREDGLDDLYRGPYDVIEVNHPNVKSPVTGRVENTLRFN